MNNLMNLTSLSAAKGLEKRKITAAAREFGERSEVSACICIHREMERKKIKGLSLLQFSTILESADTDLITNVPFCSGVLLQAINQYLRSHC